MNDFAVIDDFDDGSKDESKDEVKATIKSNMKTKKTTAYCNKHRKHEDVVSEDSEDSYTPSVQIEIHLRDEDKITDLKESMKTSIT